MDFLSRLTTPFRRYGKRAAVGVTVFILLGGILGIAALDRIIHTYTEYLWFSSFDATASFWAQYKWSLIIWSLATIFISAWLLYFPVRLLWNGNKRIGGRAEKAWRLITIGFSATVIIFAGIVSAKWIVPQWSFYLLFLFQSPYGMKEPIFGWDISYYLFTLPILKEMGAILYFILAVTAGLTILVWFISKIRKADNTNSSRPHLLSLGILVVTALIIFAAEVYLVKIPSLAYTDHTASDGNQLFYGAGALEAGLIRGFFLALAITTIIALGLIIRTLIVNRDRPLRAMLTMGIMIGGLIVLMPIFVNDVLPKLFFRIVIGPSEITTQERYIRNNIAMTREGFSLSRTQEREFVPEKNPIEIAKIVSRNPLIIKNIRLHDYRMLLPTFQQMQGLRQYYRFYDVDVDRYRLGPDKEYRHLMLSVRELDTDQIPGNWINKHLQYTHGYGVVAIPVNVIMPGGLPQFLVKDFPPRSEHKELSITRPQIYFGEKEYPWSLVKTTQPEIDYPEGSEHVYTHYQGKGGVSLFTSWVRRLAFAWQMKSLDIILTPYITRETRIIYNRSIYTIARKIAPFLHYDKDPYIVITPQGQLFWIIDAMTTSRYFPHVPQVNGINYIRNAVKVVIDPYNGTTRFYVFDEMDPLIKAWAKVYPGIFRPKSEMPPELKAHVRFPEDMFHLMAEAYKIYHMQNPRVFYNKEDMWASAEEIVDVGKRQLVAPYYIVERFEEKEELVLMLPFTPKAKENLVGWLAVRIEGEHYGKLIAYKFPKDETVYGTMQIEARINQEPKISSQITLWNQHGSQAKHGNLLVIPVENKVLLYVEPLYISATNAAMPELRRVSVYVGDKLEMMETFPEALNAVLGVNVMPPRDTK